MLEYSLDPLATSTPLQGIQISANSPPPVVPVVVSVGKFAQNCAAKICAII